MSFEVARRPVEGPILSTGRVVHRAGATRVALGAAAATIAGMTALPVHPFRTADAAAYGVTPRQLRDLVACGVVRRVLRGVYCRADVADDLTLRARAAALVLPPHAVVSDASAAWLYGIDCREPGERDLAPALEVVSIGGADRSRRSQLRGGKRALAPDDVCELDGVLVTTPLRTVSDLACRRGRYRAMAALDLFAHEFGIGVPELERMVRRYAGRRGVTQFRELIHYVCPLAESPRESWTRLAIIDAGLPAPKPQHIVELDGFGQVRLDLAYPALRIAVEYDGKEFHTSDEDKEADRLRRQALREAGWIVIVVVNGDFHGAGLERWLGELRVALTERRPTTKRRYARSPYAAPRRRRTHR